MSHLTWTPEQLQEYTNRLSRKLDTAAQPLRVAPSPSTAKRGPTGRMNKLETAYAMRLDMLLYAGQIRWYAFEKVKLRLADKTYYTPDFFVILPGGEIECHETKGFMRDDAAVKIKVAASLFPHFQFILVTKKSGDWKLKYYDQGPDRIHGQDLLGQERLI